MSREALELLQSIKVGEYVHSPLTNTTRGWRCKLCWGFGDDPKASAIEHESDCPLNAARQALAATEGGKE